MTESLKLRIITAVFLIVAALIFILAFPTPWFAVTALILVVSIGGVEWANLVNIKNVRQGLYVAWMLLLAYFAYKSTTLSWFFVTLGFFWWFINLVMLIRYKQGTPFYKDNPLMLRLAGFFVILSAWSAAVILHAHSPYLVLFLVLLVAAADSGAYFAGKAFGKNKLVPQISPGKTREGLVGGFIAALIVAFIAASFFDLGKGFFSSFIYLSAITALLSVAGDLFVSLMKREAGAKDSGNILPGHGGILDRVDGLIATLPLFALGINWSAIQI
ncbi:MAG: phosphatidate cytidylyltransferase [Cocleimonas sp.]